MKNHIQLLSGDCMDHLALLEPNSVDAIVTDPPYGLTSKKARVGFAHCLRYIALQVQFPYLNNTDPQPLEVFHLASIDSKVSSLGSVENAVNAGVGVPVGSVNFNDGEHSREPEIDNARPSTSLSAKGILRNKGDAPLSDVQGHPTFELRRGKGLSFCQGQCSCFRQLGPGLIGVPIVPLTATNSSGLLGPISPPRKGSTGDDVRLGNNAAAEANAATGIVTSGGAEDASMLVLDLARRTFEIRPAAGAGVPYFLVQQSGPPEIRTVTGAGCLSAVSETTDGCGVGLTANGTDALNIILVHPGIVSFLASIVPERGFMNKEWDEGSIAFSPAMWALALRVLRPGGFALVMGSTRTYHRLVCAIEDAGFEVKDTITWHHGSGFPKSMDISKQIDKMAGRLNESITALKMEMRSAYKMSGKTLAQIDAECGFRAANYLTMPEEGKRPDPWVHTLPSEDKWQRIIEVIGDNVPDDFIARLNNYFSQAQREVVELAIKARSTAGSYALPTMGADVKYATWEVTTPSTDAAKQWDGWGTALKPSTELICLARKPLSESTIAANVLKWGTGGLNIEATRVQWDTKSLENDTKRRQTPGTDITGGSYSKAASARPGEYNGEKSSPSGRWPTNLLFSHDPECTEDTCIGAEAGCPVAMLDQQGGHLTSGKMKAGTKRANRAGWAGPMPETTANDTPADSGGPSRFFPTFYYCGKASRKERGEGNDHPTIKPIALLQWLCRLVTPPGGTVLDPYMGSGSAGIAAQREGFGYIGIERDEHYMEIAQQRLGLSPVVAQVQEEV